MHPMYAFELSCRISTNCNSVICLFLYSNIDVFDTFPQFILLISTVTRMSPSFKIFERYHFQDITFTQTYDSLQTLVCTAENIIEEQLVRTLVLDQNV